MNLTQLNVFREVMQSASISQAARNLGRTQPAVSLALKNLEENLGFPLFERVGRQLLPVPEAHYLLAEATEILDRLATVRQTMQSLLSARSGTLNLAAMPGPSNFLFPRYISEAIGANRDIRISLSSRSSQQIHEMAASHSVDFGFADTLAQPKTAPQYDESIFSGNCFCALSAEHRLAKRNSIALAELHNEPMGALQPNHLISQRTAEAFQSENATFNRQVSSQFFLQLLQFVGAGQCCAIVDPLTVASERFFARTRNSVVFVPLTFPLRYRYSILTPSLRPLSQLARLVRDGWQAEVMRLLADVGAMPSLDCSQSASSISR